MTDSELQRQVMEELRWEPSVNAAHIGVAVKGGIVTLTGHVPSLAEKFAAEQAAKRVQGVRAVANELDVKLPGDSRRTDEDIARAAVFALQSNTLVPADKIKFAVTEGWIKLEGAVEWEYQREAAEEVLRNLPGVTGISNLVIVKPSIPPTDINAKIEDAFKRSAERDARRIKVEVRGSKVILRGRVRSGAEKQAAERVAWSAPGVTEVENEIVIRQPKPVWLLVTALVVAISLLFVAVASPELVHRFQPGSAPVIRTTVPGQDETAPGRPDEPRLVPGPGNKPLPSIAPHPPSEKTSPTSKTH
ncbi:MAG TPA: BON domain-containing protein [Gemmataceae bacterium]|jgi:osmotically-inducible protein OsmY|nr:BON domain-containing protein [Gemmataceae bacterium]